MSNSEYTQFVIAMDKCPSEHALLHATTGLAGECGEVLQVITKAVRRGEEVDALKIRDEAGDILWFLTRLVSLYGWDLDDVMQHNVRKLQERYKV